MKKLLPSLAAALIAPWILIAGINTGPPTGGSGGSGSITNLSNDNNAVGIVTGASIGTNTTDILAQAAAMTTNFAIARERAQASIFRADDYYLSADGTNDALCVQRAIYAASSNGGGTIALSDRIYNFSAQGFSNAPPFGPWSGSDTINFKMKAQVQMPMLDLHTNKPIAIIIKGAYPAVPNYDWGGFNDTELATNGTVILSRRTDGAADCSIFGSGAMTNSTWNLNGVLMRLENLTIRTINNPTFSAVNGQYTAMVQVEDCFVDTGTPYAQMTNAPSNDCYGIRMQGGQNFILNSIKNTDVVGYPVCYYISENGNYDNIGAWFGNVGFVTAHCYGIFRAGKISVTGCPYGISRLTSPPGTDIAQDPLQSSVMDIGEYLAEHVTEAVGGRTWMTNKADLYDPTNHFRGRIGYHSVTTAVGQDDSWLTVGGTNLSQHNLHNGQQNFVMATQLYVNNTNLTTLLAGKLSTSTGLTNQASYNSSLGIGTPAGAAAISATNAYESVMLGTLAGNLGTNAYSSVIIGHQAGDTAHNAHNSVFIGKGSGYQAPAPYSVFIGEGSGNVMANASQSVFLGYKSGTNRAMSLWIDAQEGLGMPLIYGDFDTRTLRLGDTNGSHVRITGNQIFSPLIQTPILNAPTSTNGTNWGTLTIVSNTPVGLNAGGTIISNVSQMLINRSSSSGVREIVAKGSVSDAGNAALFICNTTATDANFVPTIAGFYDTAATRSSLAFYGYITAANDTGLTPIVQILAARTSSASDPVNGTLAKATSRILFAVGDADDGAQKLAVLPNGNVQIAGVVVPTNGIASLGSILAPSYRTLSGGWIGLTNVLDFRTNCYTFTAGTNIAVTNITFPPGLGTNETVWLKVRSTATITNSISIPNITATNVAMASGSVTWFGVTVDGAFDTNLTVYTKP